MISKIRSMIIFRSACSYRDHYHYCRETLKDISLPWNWEPHFRVLGMRASWSWEAVSVRLHLCYFVCNLSYKVALKGASLWCPTRELSFSIGVLLVRSLSSLTHQWDTRVRLHLCYFVWQPLTTRTPSSLVLLSEAPYFLRVSNITYINYYSYW